MDFDNLQSVSSVSDTLPYEAISITGRDCFWDGSVPNPLVSQGRIQGRGRGGGGAPALKLVEI
jgi:hypothetical protein